MSAVHASPAALEASAARRGSLSWAIAATAVVMVLLLWHGGVWRLVGGQDLHGAFLPKYHEAARALLGEGRLPLWNPWEVCGTPLFAAIQSLVLYLPVPLLFASLPSYWALQGLYAFNVLVLAWGTLAYLRRSGVTAPCALIAVPVTIAGVFSSYSMVGFDHPNFLGSVAWVPWLLLCWRNAVDRGPGVWLPLLALAYAAQWLAGYPDFAMDTAILLFVAVLIDEGATPLRRAGVLVAGLALGTALAAVQLVPLSEAVRESFRADAMATYDQPRQLFAVVSAGLFRALVIDRYGIPALLLAAAALWRFRRSRLAWLAALLVATFAGDPPLNLIYRLPPFSSVRYALGWSHVAPLFLGMLVASAVQDAVTSRDRRLRAVVLALALVVAGTSAWTIVRAPQMLRPVSPDYELLAQRVPALAEAQAALPGRPRLVSGRETDSGMTVRHRLSSATGYDPSMPPRRVTRLIHHVSGTRDSIVRGMTVERHPELAALMGVGLVAVPRSYADVMARHGFVPVRALPPNDVLLYREPVPRARIVHRATAAADEAASFALTVEPGRDLAATAVVETTDPLPELAVPQGRAREDARIVVDLPERVEIEATLAAPGLLVLTDTWYPGWRAEVDGGERPILRADYAFRAVALPAGTHRVVFRYQPASLRIGAAISAAALVAMVAVVAAGRSRRRRAPDG
ncbi:MAG: YfhO family protein [Thermodesulfobacteriota bacterium]